MEDSLFGGDRIDSMVAVVQTAKWMEAGRIVRWPSDDRKDRAMVQRLIREHPDKDVLVELEKWKKNIGAKEFKKRVVPRARVTTWFCYDKRYGANGTQPSNRAKRLGRPGSSVGGAPSQSFIGSGIVSF